MKRVHITGINWDTTDTEDYDDTEIVLPKEVYLDVDIDEDCEDDVDDIIADSLSDAYGFCVFGFEWSFA